MKIHISNTYGGVPSDLYGNQKRIATIGKELGFFEMGIPRYPVSSDTPEMLSKRLDEIMASVDKGEMVFVQLPTGNGWDFDSRLLQRLNTYHAKIVLLIEAPLDTIDPILLNTAEHIVIYSPRYMVFLTSNAVMTEKCRVQSLREYVRDAVIKSLLQQIVAEYNFEGTASPSCDDNTVQICMGLHDVTGMYSREVGITMKSVLDHTEARICFHIFIDDTVSAINKSRLRMIAEQYGSLVEFHLIDPSVFDMDNPSIKHFTVGTMFRLMIPDVLPELSKVIYLDADLLILKDIQELWEMDISGYALLAVRDHAILKTTSFANYIVQQNLMPKERYFNAGVLGMNLERIREKGHLVDMVNSFLQDYPNSPLPDQDALNYLFYEETGLVDASWNIFTSDARNINLPYGSNIYHYAGQRTISYEDAREWDMQYLEYKMQMPWPKQDILREFFRAIRCSYSHIYTWEKLNRILWLKEHKIVFCGGPKKSVMQLQNILIPREDDIWIKELNEETLKKIQELIRADKEKYLFMVLPELCDGKILAMFEGWGLKRDENYFVIPTLMTGDQGGYAR